MSMDPMVSSCLVLAALLLAGCNDSAPANPPPADVPVVDASPIDAPSPIDLPPAVDAPEVAVCPAGDALRGSPACLACQAAHCCINASNCADDPECVATLLCDNGACRAQHPAGVWNWSGLVTCRRNHCAAECGVGQARCGNITPEPATCATCLRDMCCDEASACGASDECLAFVYQCLDQNRCAPPDACSRACRARYPAGAEVFDAMDACLRSRCRNC